MAAYELWYRRLYDGRAPSTVFVDVDYDWAGDVQADSVKDVALRVALMSSDSSNLEGHRAIRVGDAVKNPKGEYYILTPTGVWSRVIAVEGGVAG